MKKCKKIKYSNQKEADIAILKWENKEENLSNSVSRRSYFCKECSSWHLTSRVNNKSGLNYIERYDALNLQYNKLLTAHESLKKIPERQNKQIASLLKQLSAKNELLRGFQGYTPYNFEKEYFWYLD